MCLGVSFTLTWQVRDYDEIFLLTSIYICIYSIIGRSLVLHHYRETESCGGAEELLPIDQNLNYDVDYQVCVAQSTTHACSCEQGCPGDLTSLKSREASRDYLVSRLRLSYHAYV